MTTPTRVEWSTLAAAALLAAVLAEPLAAAPPIQSGVPSALGYLPDDFALVVSIRMPVVRSSGTYKRLKSKRPEEVEAVGDLVWDCLGLPFGHVSQLTGYAGPPSERISRLTVVLGSSTWRETLTVVDFSKALDQRAIGEMLRGVFHGNWKQERIGRVTVYTDRYRAVDFPDAQTMLIGHPEMVKAVLRRKEKPKPSEKLPASLDALDFAKPIVATAVIPSLPRPPVRQVSAELMAIMQVLSGLEVVAVEIDLASGLTASASASCWDAKTAETAEKTIRDLLARLKRQHADDPDVARRVGKLLDSIHVSRSGRKLHARMALDQATVDRMIDASVRPRPARGQSAGINAATTATSSWGERSGVPAGVIRPETPLRSRRSSLLTPPGCGQYNRRWMISTESQEYR